MSKNGKKAIIPKTIGQYAEEQYRKSQDFRKTYDEELARLHIGYKIAQLRKGRKLTQQELARRINSNQQTISRIEDIRNIRLNFKTLIRVAAALQAYVRVDFIPKELAA
ncbi:MAG: helix-turn-helix transcriptional regulator [Candidatus Omnitrophota bacterium]|nr:helix-turn-helix transcriptional regulator [Candidatus Omnitrophota bacterium]